LTGIGPKPPLGMFSTMHDTAPSTKPRDRWP